MDFEAREEDLADAGWRFHNLGPNKVSQDELLQIEKTYQDLSLKWVNDNIRLDELDTVSFNCANGQVYIRDITHGVIVSGSAGTRSDSEDSSDYYYGLEEVTNLDGSDYTKTWRQRENPVDTLSSIRSKYGLGYNGFRLTEADFVATFPELLEYSPKISIYTDDDTYYDLVLYNRKVLSIMYPFCDGTLEILSTSTCEELEDLIQANYDLDNVIPTIVA